MARTQIFSAEQVRRIISRLAYEIVERNRGTGSLVVLGIPRKGILLARALVENMASIEPLPVAVHELEVEPYRDDRNRDAPAPTPAGAVDVTERDVILVDDVLFTGRTARAALDAIVRYGRPRSIQLAVLIDRGHREYPIQPDYAGRIIPTRHRERVFVDPDRRFATFVEE